MAEEPRRLTVHQRVTAVMADLGAIRPTGRNAFGARAASIQDVEQVVRPLLARHGVSTQVTMTSLERLAQNEWLVELFCTFTADDNPDDAFSVRWKDTGSNVAAACSYCRKGLFKAQFHLASETDENPQAPSSTRTAEGAPRTTGGAPPAARQGTATKRQPTGRECPACGGGLLWYVEWPNGGRSISCGRHQAGCKYREEAPPADLIPILVAGPKPWPGPPYPAALPAPDEQQEGAE